MSFCSKVCTIEMKSSIDTMVLLPKRLDVIQERDMNLFRVTDYSLTFAIEEDEKQGIRMSLVMKRKITSEMMTTYFPSLLLTLITFATTFFKPFFFEAALSVNLTTMLVMTTIFISKMEGLPPTSDTKMIDYWLILCQLVPFTEVVLQTAMEYFRDDETSAKQKTAENLDFVDVGTSHQDLLVKTKTPAWTAPAKGFGRVNNSSLPTLKTIGNFFHSFRDFFMMFSLFQKRDSFLGLFCSYP